jgi:hypothetical protein
MNPIVMPYRSAIVKPSFGLPISVAAHSVFAAKDDMSAFILEDFLKAGFREVEWRYGFEEWQNTTLWREMGSVCPVCFALDGQRFKIEWLLKNMHHNAPKYSLSHVNCACQLFRINRTEEMLDFSEGVEVAPSEIPDVLKDEPITLDEVAPERREVMGLPPDQNEWTDIQWQWDQTRNEFVPLKTLQDEGGQQQAVQPWLWDEQAGEMIPHEEWVRRYGG